MSETPRVFNTKFDLDFFIFRFVFILFLAFNFESVYGQVQVEIN